MELTAYLQQQSRLIDRALAEYLPAGPRRIAQAMRYSVNAGGKRLRPILLLEAAKVCGKTDPKLFLPAACAFEFIHTYSLIHDDLPAMDNDDLRRGKPTSHKKFGEATAILAGDALLTEAFRLFAEGSARAKLPPERVLRALVMLAEAAGFDGMIGGQMADTVGGSSWRRKKPAEARKELHYIHMNKTAALIVASLKAGAVLAGAALRQEKALADYGCGIGLAFQIADDVLDLTADKKLLGKRGSDIANDKLTWPALYGLEQSRATASLLVKDARKRLSMFGDKAEMLDRLAGYIIERQY